MLTVSTAVMHKSTWFIAIALSAALIGSSSHARDLGTIGPSYAIPERNLLDVIQERLKERMKDGFLEKQRRKLTERSKRYITRPRGLPLPRTQTYRAYDVSLEFVTTEDITDGQGHILYPVGTRVNPLVFQSLTKILCFADGDDPDQVKWLNRHCSDPLKHKLILVQGNYPKVTEQLNRRLYFDQRGYLVDRFEIQAVPATVRQKEHILHVEEIPVR